MEENKKSLLEEYEELSKKSLVRVQYSCCGIATSIHESEDIPIVNINTNETNNENETQGS